MIITDVEQGTPEWFELRLGKPTASRFKDIYTSTGKSSASADTYMNMLVAEVLAGKGLESFSSEWMSRGTELEPKAREMYEFLTDNEVQQVGFVSNDDATVGCSPDGLMEIGAKGLEIKCPSPPVHIKYLLAGKCPSEYVPQVQGSMWICERDTWDFMSYHPDLPNMILTVERDEKYIAGLTEAMEVFLEKMAVKLEKLKEQIA